MVREVRIFDALAGKPIYGSGYFVTAYAVGAQVASGSSSDVISVHAGHDFVANDKGMVFEAGSSARYFRVGSVTAEQLTLYGGQVLSVAAGEYLVNLGADTGFTTPNYDGSGAVIYTDMDYDNVATNSTVQATNDGRAIYFHKGIARWELVRSNSSTPFALYMDTGAGTVDGPDSSTDNSLARFDGTDGTTLQNSAVIVDDSGNISGINTASIAGDAIVGHDVTIANALDVAGTATVTGVSSLDGGIGGGIPRMVGTWPVNSATAGTDTACTNGTAYVGSVFVPANMTITGVQYLVGSVGGTTKVVASLHSAFGVLRANSATAGTTVGTAAQIQQVPFTATYAAVGPAWYFVALTFDGTTAKFRSIPAHCNAGSGVIGNGVTQTFGTPANFTAPTTFTADKVPVASVY